MQKQPLNTTPISQFINLVKSADSSRQKEVRMDIEKAKKLHYCLTELLARLNGDLEELLLSSKKDDKDAEVITVNMDGGDNW